ncbi:MAG: DUF2080 family transposase-associated protein [Methanobacteriota archaeon]
MPLQKFEVQGEDYVQKVAKRQSDTSSVIYLPASWAGKRVAVILLEQELPH